jgi:hypothetical protein
MPIIYNVEQGSPEWDQLRAGIITDSNIWKIMPGARGSYLKERDKYMTQKAYEIITGKSMEKAFSSKAMDWGTEWEPEARDTYILETGRNVQTVGFVKLNEKDRHGGSPDGIVGDPGLLEIKCPEPHTHADTMIRERVDRKYIFQMNAGMLHNEKEWCDFVSFDPRAPLALQIYIKRFIRDEVMIAEIKIEIEKFLSELDTLVEGLRNRIAAQTA